jgi:hypothetical protein
MYLISCDTNLLLIAYNFDSWVVARTNAGEYNLLSEGNAAAAGPWRDPREG